MHKKMLAACCAVIAALLLLLPLPVGAAAAGGVGEAYAAAVYDNASGMPFSEANLTIQTPDGFLYIGSYGGLTRFDGRRFEAVEGVSSAVSLFTDSRGRLWVGTSEMGAVCLDGGSLTVYGPEEGLNSSVRGFYEEENGDILMSTRAGLFLLDGNGQISPLPDERFRGKYILSIAGDGEGNVYGVVRDEGYFMLRGGEVAEWWPVAETGFDSEVIYPDPDRSGYVYFGTEGSELYYGSMREPVSALKRIELGSVTGVNCLLKDGDRLWVCAGDGMGYLEEGGTFTRLEHLPVKNAFEHIMKDREGNLWVSSSRRGVMKLSPGSFADVTAIAGLGNPVVNAVKSAGGKLYIGTDTGLLVTDGSFAPAEDPASALLGEVRVRSITEDTAGKLWFSTYSAFGLVCMDPETGEWRCYPQADGLASDRVRDALQLSDGDMLVSTSEGLCRLREGTVVRTYGPADGLQTAVLCMCRTPDGTVYLGSDGDGIFTLAGDALRPCAGGDVLPGGVILSLKYDAQRDRVWVVTGAYALACLADGELRGIDRLPGGEKNASPYYDLIPMDDGRLWLLGGSGICVVSGDALLAGDVSDALYYGVNSGLPHMSAANSRSDVTEDGVAFLAGADGVTAVDLNRSLHAVSAPQLCIPYVEIDGERLWLREGERVVIPREARRIRIYAYALTYSLEDPDVRYRLEGFDAEDSVAAASRLPVVSYTNLPGGSYTFRLSLAEAGGEELRLELVKEKRLYEYPAVSIAGAVILLLLLAWFVSRLLKRQKLRLEARGEEERIGSELRMAANIQADLLPKGDPAFPGRDEFEIYASMLPASEIGGDFYDFFLIDDDHLALAAADVSGRGVPAALTMTLSKTLLKSAALHESSPAQVLREVDIRLRENGGANMSVAAWLGFLELSTGLLLWADAGHVRPLVCHSGSWSFLEKENSPALGSAEPEAPDAQGRLPIADHRFRMQPGDMLFQYSDGITEAADRQKNPFGEERLLAALGEISGAELKETGEFLRKEIDGFTQGAPRSDDITMLLVRYHGRSEDRPVQPEEPDV